VLARRVGGNVRGGVRGVGGGGIEGVVGCRQPLGKLVRWGEVSKMGRGRGGGGKRLRMLASSHDKNDDFFLMF